MTPEPTGRIEEEIRKAWNDATLVEETNRAHTGDEWREIWMHHEAPAYGWDEYLEELRFIDAYLSAQQKAAATIASLREEVRNLEARLDKSIQELDQAVVARKGWFDHAQELKELEDKAAAYIEALKGYHEAIPSTWTDLEKAKAAYESRAGEVGG